MAEETADLGVPSINRTDMTENDTSGYSSAKTSPQSTGENSIKPKKKRLRPGRRTRQLLKAALLESESEWSEKKEDDDEEEEEECEFRPQVVENEMEPHKEWYNKLIKLRCDHPGGVKYVFPPFPPPPLASAMLAASRASTVNPFDEVKRAAVSSSATSPSTSSPNTINRFCPTDFRALPPPHVFLGMVRTLAPHQYVDLTYALAAAVLLDIGAKVPDHYPPLPPRIDPFRRSEEEEHVSSHHGTEVSSQSSSGGEYSDDDEETKRCSKVKRERNHQRRAERTVRLTARRNFLEFYAEPGGEKTKNETFPRDQNYKSKTLSKFIPTRSGLLPAPKSRAPPLISPFFPFPPSHDLPDHRAPIIPIMMIPFPVPPVPQPLLQASKNSLKLRNPAEKERKEPIKIMFPFPGPKTRWR